MIYEPVIGWAVVEEHAEGVGHLGVAGPAPGVVPGAQLLPNIIFLEPI